MTVQLVTDSSAGLPDWCVTSASAISVLPLHVLRGDEDYREGLDAVPDSVVGDPAAHTSTASPEEVRKVLTEALDRSDGAGVVVVTLSRRLSGTWDVVRTVADSLGPLVRVHDSASIASGLGFSVRAAAATAVDGADLGAVYRKAVEVSAESYCLCMVERLEWLRRGGRLSTAAAVLGTVLATKPILHLVDGVLTLRERVRTRSKALAALIDAAAGAEDSGEAAIAVHHVDAPSAADLIVDGLRQATPAAVIHPPAALGFTLGVHLGPGALGVVVNTHPDAIALPVQRDSFPD